MRKQILLLGALTWILCFGRLAHGLHTVEYEICTAAGTQAKPDNLYTLIVWQDNRNGDWDIYGYDFSTETEYAVCTADGNQTNPSIGMGSVLTDPIVAWEDDRNGNSDVYGYRLLGHYYDFGIGEEIVICSDPCEQRNPISTGGFVCWQDNRNGDWDIYAKVYEYDQEPNEVVICDDAGDQINPDGCYDTVTWQDDRNGNWDIYARDLEDANLWAICTEDGNQTNPACEMGPQFVWEDDRNSNHDIYGYFCGTALCDFNDYMEVAVCTDSNSQQSPDIFSEHIVVWQDNRNGSWDIYSYIQDSYYTGTEFVISVGESGRTNPVGDCDIVLWEDDRDGNNDIYAARICMNGNDNCGGNCAMELFDDEPYFGSTEGMHGSWWGEEYLTSSCGFNDFTDAWHVYNPAIGGPVTITTEGSSLDTILSVFNSCYRGDIYEDPIELACNDDYCLANAASKVALDVVKGKSYHIRVSGFNDQTGDYQIVVKRGAAADPIRSDLNGDGRVDMLDFVIFSSEWLMGN